MRRGGLPHAAGRNSREAAAWRLGPAGKTARVARGARDGTVARSSAAQRWLDGGKVAPVVVDEHGELLQLEGSPGVRRRRSIEEWSSSEGTHRKGADGGDARAESDVEKGFWRWKTGEVDTWAMGEACVALGRGRTRQMVRGVRKFSAGRRRLRFNGKWQGGGPGGVDAAWRQSGRERGRDMGP
jgi:hypothetical protein